MSDIKVLHKSKIVVSESLLNLSLLTSFLLILGGHLSALV